MTDQEIVRALRYCGSCRGTCLECPAHTREGDCMKLLATSADLIERLTAENAALRDGQASEVETLRKEIEWKDMVIALAQRKQAEAEAERDALIEQIKERHDCIDCKHNDYCEFDNANVIDCMNCVQEECPCAGCCDYSRWDWQGLLEVPEEGGKHE